MSTNTNRHTPTGAEVLAIARANPDIIIPEAPVTKRAGKRGSAEHDEQVALFQWVEQNLDKYPVLAYMFAIPNGGQRSKATAGKLKAEGVKAGVPDIFLPVGNRSCNGLFLEMKAGKNRASQHQERYITYLREAMYMVMVCYSARQAQEIIEWYLTIE